MARTWKRIKDKGKPGTPWQLTYTDWRLVEGKWRAWERSRTGYTDKRETLALGTQLEDKARMRRDGRIDDRDDRRALEARRPIDEHIDDYMNSLQAKGSNEKHVAQSIGYIREIVTALDWGSIGAVRADSLLKHINDRITRLGQSPRTFNAWLVALKGFSHWLVLHDRLATDPLASAKKIRQSADVRRKRRALSNIETELLIHSTDSGPDCHFRRKHTKHTLTGPDRAMLYQVLLGTGLRLGEVASLTPKSFDLDAKDGPVVIVEAAYSKRRRRDEQPIPEPLAAALRPWVAGKPKTAPLWPLPYKVVERLLIPDLCRARAHWLLDAPKGKARKERRDDDILRYQDSAERYADIHSMRHTYITRLNMSGVPLTVAQRLARHSSPILTANVYTHIGLADQKSALARAFEPKPAEPPEQEVVQATGTDGAPSESETESCAQRYAQRESDSPTLKLADAGTADASKNSVETRLNSACKSLQPQGLGKTGRTKSEPGRRPISSRGDRTPVELFADQIGLWNPETRIQVSL